LYKQAKSEKIPFYSYIFWVENIVNSNHAKLKISPLTGNNFVEANTFNSNSAKERKNNHKKSNAIQNSKK